jgi:hypothetical protein
MEDDLKLINLKGRLKHTYPKVVADEIGGQKKLATVSNYKFL